MHCSVRGVATDEEGPLREEILPLAPSTVSDSRARRPWDAARACAHVGMRQDLQTRPRHHDLSRLQTRKQMNHASSA